MVIPERIRLELAAEAVRRARDAGDDATLAACLAALCDAIADPDDCAERRDRATEIIDIAGRLRDPVLGLLGRRLRLVALLEAGAIADWEADALAYQTAAEALRHPLYAWYVPLWRGMRALARDSEWLPVVAQVAETLALIGSADPHPAARWAYDALAPYAGLFVVEGIGAAVRGPVHRHLALLADVLGDREAAAAHRTEAVAQARALGATALVARIEREARPSPAAGDRPEQAAGDGGPDQVFRRDGEVWTIGYGGRQVRLRDSKGLRDLHALLTRAGTAVAALDLASAAPGRVPAAPDTGEVIDTQARSAYRQRLRELEEEATEADAAADIGRSARVAAERDALVEALTQAYGLGGRVRRAGSDAERARTAVTARIKDAIRRIGEAHPDLGRHLARSVRTGTFCVYDPDQPARWSG